MAVTRPASAVSEMRSTAVSGPYRTVRPDTSTPGTKADATSGRVLDIRLIRDDLEADKAALARRGEDPGPVDRVAELDQRQRELGVERDELRHRVKELSR